MAEPMSLDDLMTSNQAAEYLGCTRSSIENYRMRGWLHTIRLANRRVLFLRKEVEKLREELLAKRFKTDNPELVVQAERPLDTWAFPKKRPSLLDDPDPLIFSKEVWEAVRQYQAANRAR